MRIMIHRKEQWDLNCRPLICVHLHRATETRRLLCLWLWGVQIGRVVLGRRRGQS